MADRFFRKYDLDIVLAPAVPVFFRNCESEVNASHGRGEGDPIARSNRCRQLSAGAENQGGHVQRTRYNLFWKLAVDHQMRLAMDLRPD